MNKQSALPAEPTTMRIPSIDYLRSFAIFSVILLHTIPIRDSFDSYLDGSGASIFEGVIKLILGRLGTCAIPFFFVTAGYFFRKKILSGDSPIWTLGSYSRRLLIIWIFWFMIYILLPPPLTINTIVQPYGYFKYLYMQTCYGLSDPLALMIRGSATHLWFLPALIIALCANTMLSMLINRKIILPFALGLYCILLIQTSYLTSRH
ncbi:MAG: acyltransferase family protein [Nitrospirae bacterium]|nr:acyltransferase family protein [Nitrospirota bacterium]